MFKTAYKLTLGREAGTSSGLMGAVSNVVGGMLGGGQVIDTTDEPQASTVVDLSNGTYNSGDVPSEDCE
jgi:phage-related minor tail protein